MGGVLRQIVAVLSKNPQNGHSRRVAQADGVTEAVLTVTVFLRQGRRRFRLEAAGCRGGREEGGGRGGEPESGELL